MSDLFKTSDHNDQQRLTDAGYKPAHVGGSHWWWDPNNELVSETEALKRLNAIAKGESCN